MKIYFKKIVACVLLCVFSWHELFFNPVVLQAAELRNAPHFSRVAYSHGLLQSEWNGSKDSRVFIIEDAHTSLEAQKNIAGLITEIDPDIVCVEGYAGDLSERINRAFASLPKEDRKSVARSMLMMGEMTGAQYASFVSDEPLKIIGVESHEKYAENIEQLKRLYDLRSELALEIAPYLEAMKTLKVRFFSRDIQELDALYDTLFETEAYAEYCARLVNASHVYKINLRRYPELEKFETSQAEENLTRIDYSRLFEEARDVHRTIKATKLKGCARYVADAEDAFGTIEKLFAAHLTREEFKNVYQNEHTLCEALRFSILWLKEQMPEISSRNSELSYTLLQKGFEAAYDFYNLAAIRDKRLVENTYRALFYAKARRGVLVAGGFHSEGIQKYLRELNISYVVLRPRILSLTGTLHKQYDERAARPHVYPFIDAVSFLTSKLVLENLFTDTQVSDISRAFFVELLHLFAKRSHRVTVGTLKSLESAYPDTFHYRIDDTGLTISNTRLGKSIEIIYNDDKELTWRHVEGTIEGIVTEPAGARDAISDIDSDTFVQQDPLPVNVPGISSAQRNDNEDNSEDFTPERTSLDSEVLQIDVKDSALVAQLMARHIRKKVNEPCVYYPGIGAGHWPIDLQYVLERTDAHVIIGSDIFTVENNPGAVLAIFKANLKMALYKIGVQYDENDITVIDDGVYEVSFIYRGSQRTFRMYHNIDGTDDYPREIASGYNVLFLNEPYDLLIEMHDPVRTALLGFLDAQAGFVVVQSSSINPDIEKSMDENFRLVTNHNESLQPTDYVMYEKVKSDFGSERVSMLQKGNASGATILYSTPFFVMGSVLMGMLSVIGICGFFFYRWLVKNPETLLKSSLIKNSPQWTKTLLTLLLRDLITYRRERMEENKIIETAPVSDVKTGEIRDGGKDKENEDSADLKSLDVSGIEEQSAIIKNEERHSQDVSEIPVSENPTIVLPQFRTDVVIGTHPDFVRMNEIWQNRNNDRWIKNHFTLLLKEKQQKRQTPQRRVGIYCQIALAELLMDRQEAAQHTIDKINEFEPHHPIMPIYEALLLRAQKHMGLALNALIDLGREAVLRNDSELQLFIATAITDLFIRYEKMDEDKFRDELDDFLDLMKSELDEGMKKNILLFSVRVLRMYFSNRGKIQTDRAHKEKTYTVVILLAGEELALYLKDVDAIVNDYQECRLFSSASFDLAQCFADLGAGISQIMQALDVAIQYDPKAPEIFSFLELHESKRIAEALQSSNVPLAREISAEMHEKLQKEIPTVQHDLADFYSTCIDLYDDDRANDSGVRDNLILFFERMKPVSLRDIAQLYMAVPLPEVRDFLEVILFDSSVKEEVRFTVAQLIREIEPQFVEKYIADFLTRIEQYSITAQYEKAERERRIALEIEPSNKKLQQLYYAIRKARIFTKEGDDAFHSGGMTRAIDSYQKALRHVPRSVYLKEQSEAARMYAHEKHARDMKKLSIEHVVRLSERYEKEGRFTDACEQFHAAQDMMRIFLLEEKDAVSERLLKQIHEGIRRTENRDDTYSAAVSEPLFRKRRHLENREEQPVDTSIVPDTGIEKKEIDVRFSHKMSKDKLPRKKKAIHKALRTRIENGNYIQLNMDQFRKNKRVQQLYRLRVGQTRFIFTRMSEDEIFVIFFDQRDDIYDQLIASVETIMSDLEYEWSRAETFGTYSIASPGKFAFAPIAVWSASSLLGNDVFSLVGLGLSIGCFFAVIVQSIVDPVRSAAVSGSFNQRQGALNIRELERLLPIVYSSGDHQEMANILRRNADLIDRVWNVACRVIPPHEQYAHWPLMVFMMESIKAELLRAETQQEKEKIRGIEALLIALDEKLKTVQPIEPTVRIPEEGVSGKRKDIETYTSTGTSATVAREKGTRVNTVSVNALLSFVTYGVLYDNPLVSTLGILMMGGLCAYFLIQSIGVSEERVMYTEKNDNDRASNKKMKDSIAGIELLLNDSAAFSLHNFELRVKDQFLDLSDNEESIELVVRDATSVTGNIPKQLLETMGFRTSKHFIALLNAVIDKRLESTLKTNERVRAFATKERFTLTFTNNSLVLCGNTTKDGVVTLQKNALQALPVRERQIALLVALSRELLHHEIAFRDEILLTREDSELTRIVTREWGVSLARYVSVIKMIQADDTLYSRLLERTVSSVMQGNESFFESLHARYFHAIYPEGAEAVLNAWELTGYDAQKSADMMKLSLVEFLAKLRDIETIALSNNNYTVLQRVLNGRYSQDENELLYQYKQSNYDAKSVALVTKKTYADIRNALELIKVKAIENNDPCMLVGLEAERYPQQTERILEVLIATHFNVQKTAFLTGNSRQLIARVLSELKNSPKVHPAVRSVLPLMLNAKELLRVAPYPKKSDELLQLWEECGYDIDVLSEITTTRYDILLKQLRYLNFLAQEFNDFQMLARLKGLIYPSDTDMYVAAFDENGNNYNATAAALGLYQMKVWRKIQRIKKIAFQLNDTTMLARLNAWDVYPPATQRIIATVREHGYSLSPAAQALGITEKGLTLTVQEIALLARETKHAFMLSIISKIEAYNSTVSYQNAVNERDRGVDFTTRDGASRAGEHTRREIKKYIRAEENFIERFTSYIAEERGYALTERDHNELVRFEKLFPAILRIRSEYKRDCGRASYMIFDLLVSDFSVEMRKLFRAHSDDDIAWMDHAYCVIELAGVKFIVDVAADQFELFEKENGKTFSLGVLLLPARIVDLAPEQYAFYAMSNNDKGRIETYSILIKENTRVDLKGYHTSYADGVPVDIVDWGLSSEEVDFYDSARRDIDTRINSLLSFGSKENANNQIRAHFDYVPLARRLAPEEYDIPDSDRTLEIVFDYTDLHKSNADFNLLLERFMRTKNLGDYRITVVIGQTDHVSHPNLAAMNALFGSDRFNVIQKNNQQNFDYYANQIISHGEFRRSFFVVISPSIKAIESISADENVRRVVCHDRLFFAAHDSRLSILAAFIEPALRRAHDAQGKSYFVFDYAMLQSFFGIDIPQEVLLKSAFFAAFVAEVQAVRKNRILRIAA